MTYGSGALPYYCRAARRALPRATPAAYLTTVIYCLTTPAATPAAYLATLPTIPPPPHPTAELPLLRVCLVRGVVAAFTPGVCFATRLGWMDRNKGLKQLTIWFVVQHGWAWNVLLSSLWRNLPRCLATPAKQTLSGDLVSSPDMTWWAWDSGCSGVANERSQFANMLSIWACVVVGIKRLPHHDLGR